MWHMVNRKTSRKNVDGWGIGGVLPGQLHGLCSIISYDFTVCLYCI